MSVDSEKNHIACFICNQDLENDDKADIVNVTRGLEKLKKTSLERKDERIKMLLDINNIKVHVKCREKYTLKKNGKFIYDYTPINLHAWKVSPAKKKTP